MDYKQNDWKTKSDKTSSRSTSRARQGMFEIGEGRTRVSLSSAFGQGSRTLCARVGRRR